MDLRVIFWMMNDEKLTISKAKKNASNVYKKMYSIYFKTIIAISYGI